MTHTVGPGHRPLHALYVERAHRERAGVAEHDVDLQHVGAEGAEVGGKVESCGLRLLCPEVEDVECQPLRGGQRLEHVGHEGYGLYAEDVRLRTY